MPRAAFCGSRREPLFTRFSELDPLRPFPFVGNLAWDALIEIRHLDEITFSSQQFLSGPSDIIV